MNARPYKIAKTLLLLASAAVLSPTAYADDGYVEYADIVRYYDRVTRVQAVLTPAVPFRPAVRRLGGTCAPRYYRHLGYVSALRRGTAVVPGIVQIIAPRPVSTDVLAVGLGNDIIFSNAEATGAANGQTVNRATNDLN